jgi:hypothetical protein
MSAIFTAVALTVVASGYSAYSSYQQGKSAQKWNNYNAQLEEQNAATAARDAAITANQTRRANERVKSRQRAAFAANGVVGDTGSPLLTQAEQAGYLEEGALEVERQGNIQAGKHRQQAVLDRMSGRVARSAGKMNAASTILSGAASAVSTYKGLS